MSAMDPDNDDLIGVVITAGPVLHSIYRLSTTTYNQFIYASSTDNGDTWTSIWAATPANRLTIAAAGKAGTQTSFDTTSIAEGNLFRISVDQVGSTVSGAGLTVTLKV